MIPTQYCRQILPPEECNYVEKLIKKPDMDWKDGILTMIGGTADIKNKDYGSNTKKVFEGYHQDSYTIIRNFLDKDLEFQYITCPKIYSAPIFSKIIEDGYYKSHLDNEFNGHYSTTLFLNDPSEYEGGELQLLIDGEIVNHKLKKGWGVTYSTGLTHQVKKVTSGKRYACVFWTTSHINDIIDRELYYEVSKAEESIQKIIPDKTVYDDLIQFQNDPRCRLSNVKKSIVRRNLK